MSQYLVHIPITTKGNPRLECIWFSGGQHSIP